jgi:hypothetical protein
LLQAFDVLEDDPRNWKTARQKLLTRALAARLEKRLKAQGESIDWAAVSRVSHEPRGVPLAVSRGIETFDTVVARATRVRNALPIGANWHGELAASEGTR